MRAEQTSRGFTVVRHTSYANEPTIGALIQESSAIGDYSNSYDLPGSSFLFVGAVNSRETFHLNREEIAELIQRMQYWLDTGRLKVDP